MAPGRQPRHGGLKVDIEVRGLRKVFRRADGTRNPALGEVSFSLREREFGCLLGPSGCGKSTILNILAGLILPDGGEVRLGSGGGAGVGYVFQRPRLLSWRTVWENVAFGLEALGTPKGEWAERVDRHLALVGLRDAAHEYPLTLSGGMQQRVALARALAVEPEVLLMDEPFSELDELTARSLRRELLRIWRETQKTILFVSHNALEAAYLADRIFLLSPAPCRVFHELRVDIPRERSMEDP
ncbi:MAG: ABC transporter ATP-binding protein, partial [Nitrospinota bacterium]